MRRSFPVMCLILALLATVSVDADEPVFRVGFAQKDVTPPVPMPMWGYGARKDMLSQGTLDPLMAKAIVVEAGDDRVALVGLDMGRAPTTAMMNEIRAAIREQARIEHVLIVGSHTHHGPVLELTDREGFGKGRFDAAVRYLKTLPQMLSETIIEAATKLEPARLGVNSIEVPYNRNRQSKRQPPARDPLLSVMKFDSTNGRTIATLVNFAAHPVMTSGEILKFSADYPGFMMKHVEKELSAPCLFMQGASGDMSVNAINVKGPQAFGELLGEECVKVANAIETTVPEHPSIQGRVDHFEFETRIDLNNPAVLFLYGQAFFPELVRNFAEEYKNGMHPELNTILLNREIAIVGGSGEFFSNHAVRLRERSYVKHTLFFGYCNGYMNYFPTIEAISEGGYGADPPVSPAQIGAGEEMMNRALINIYSMLGKLAEGKPEPLK
ncbi:neutral/alkaline non-lysosomal ceramidase N-terminal domain-containing protein [Schlesneria sp. DSM 10557]|uniref:neutral/alkaline non-lysosomal ceramidase N-terminal domain-containing protein n=1 Tax=Schlesneria sp. DSM 10557 TaxID=3044399 RepID=UPI00359FF3C7